MAAATAIPPYLSRGLVWLIERQAPARLEFLAHDLLGDFAVPGLGQRVPEKDPLGELVAGHLALHPGQELALVELRVRAENTDCHADFAPRLIRDAKNGDLGN